MQHSLNSKSWHKTASPLFSQPLCNDFETIQPTYKSLSDILAFTKDKIYIIFKFEIQMEAKDGKSECKLNNHSIQLKRFKFCNSCWGCKDRMIF